MNLKTPYINEIYNLEKQINGYKWDSEKKVQTFPLEEHDNLWDRLVESKCQSNWKFAQFTYKKGEYEYESIWMRFH